MKNAVHVSSVDTAEERIGDFVDRSKEITN